MRPAFRNVAYNLAGQLLPMAVALVALPVLTKQAGAERLGFLGLAWALIGYFALLDLGLSRVVTRRIAMAHAAGTLAREGPLVTRLCIGMFVIVAAISAVLAFVIPVHWVVGSTASAQVQDEARVALLILWATVPATVATGILRGTLEGLQRFARANALRSFFGVWSFGAPLVILPWSHDLAALTATIAAGRYVGLFFHAHAARRAYALDVAGVTTATTAPAVVTGWRAMLREGGWLTVSNLVGPLLVTFDRIAIAHIVSLAAAAYYFVPQEIALRFLILPGAVAATIFPMLARSAHGGTEHGRISRDALLATACASLPACAALSVLSEPALRLWMGDAFAVNSAPVAAILAVGLFANCCAQVPFAWIQAVGRPDVTGRLHLLQLPFYCVLLLAGTMRYGIVGAALAWSIRAIADYALLVVASQRLFHGLSHMLRTTVIESALGIALLVGLAALRAPATGLVWPAVITACCLALTVRMGLRLTENIRR